MAIAARAAMMRITTRSSIRVNPDSPPGFCASPLILALATGHRNEGEKPPANRRRNDEGRTRRPAPRDGYVVAELSSARRVLAPNAAVRAAPAVSGRCGN